MAKNLFSIPIFFIVFRETLEAAIIVSVLLGLAEQIVNRDPNFIESIEEPRTSGDEDVSNSEPIVDDAVQRRRLLRKMRIQVKNNHDVVQCQHNRVFTCQFYLDFFRSWSRFFYRSCCWCRVRSHNFLSAIFCEAFLTLQLKIASSLSGSQRPRTCGPMLRIYGKVN